MREKIKKAISVLTVIALLLCPISAFAAQYQGTINWYSDCEDGECYGELPYYGEIFLGKTTVEAPESEPDGWSEYVFKFTAPQAGWYYLDYDAETFSVIKQEGVREDGKPYGFDYDCYTVFDENENPTGSVIKTDENEICYLDFYYGDRNFTVNVEYLGELTDVIPEQGMLDNLVFEEDFCLFENDNGGMDIVFYDGNFTAEFSGGKSFAINREDYSYSGNISEEAGTYDITLDFSGFKKDVSVSVFDLGASIDRVEIDNLEELQKNKIVVYYDGYYYVENDYEAYITVYFKDGTYSKAYCNSDYDYKPFTAPNGREYDADINYIKEMEVGSIVVYIDAADYEQFVGCTTLKRADTSDNLGEFVQNYTCEKGNLIDELYYTLAEIVMGNADFGDFYRQMIGGYGQLFKFFFTDLYRALTYQYGMGLFS